MAGSRNAIAILKWHWQRRLTIPPWRSGLVVMGGL